MRVLITGANGFVGRNVSTYLEHRGFQVLRSDVISSDIDGDVVDPSFVLTDLAKLDFDAIVHLAAIANIRRTIEDPFSCYRVNCLGTLHVLELARKKQVKRFVYASSANVYGVPSELPVKETTPLNPRVPYDFSKAISESFVQSYHAHKGLPTTVLRSWLLFGEYDLPTRAVFRFITASLRDQPLALYNAGKDTTDPYHVSNYAHAIELCLTKDEAVGEAFNVGTGRELSIRQIAEMIVNLTGSRSELQLLPPRTPQEAEPMRSYPSIQKISKTLGYRPITPLGEGLKRTIDWVAAQLKPT